MLKKIDESRFGEVIKFLVSGGICFLVQFGLLVALRDGAGLDGKQAKEVFLTVALFAHGYASIIANNALEYDEALIAEHLECAWNGAVLAASKEE